MTSSADRDGVRKSSNRFSRARLSSLTPLVIRAKDVHPNQDTKEADSAALAHGRTLRREDSQDHKAASVNSDGSALSMKPHTIQRKRPGSKFGSLGKSSILSVDEQSVGSNDGLISPMENSFGDEGFVFPKEGQRLLYHGQVQTTVGLFRKKKEYLVLTDTHLIRFKSYSRASECFPLQQTQNRRRYSTSRHSSSASLGSLHELQTQNSRSSNESESGFLLNQIVATYRVEDGRPFFITEVVYLDENTNSVGSMQLMLQDPREADVWHTSIRAASQKARLISDQPLPARTLEYVTRVLQAAQDYDENFLKVFRVVRRPAGKATGKSSSDDLAKLAASVCYLAIGINRLHLISVPDSQASPSQGMDTRSSKSSYGLVTLVSMEIHASDDSLELGFRLPLQSAVILSLASCSGPEIGRAIFRSILYLKPQWLDYTFLYSGPPEVLDDTDVDFGPVEDSGCFERALIAYCLSYGCSPYNIRYTIDYEAEDAPEFILLPPGESRRYSVQELLAIFRALRYNESFRSISFKGINLECLHGLVDLYGKDHIAFTSRSGIPIKKYFEIVPEGKSLLYQEVQALALKTYKVRRLNFGDTLPRRRPRDTYEEECASKDPGCEIAAGLLPLCRAQLTNVDWIVLSGIELGETDLEEIGPALHERLSHFRCLEVSRCGLTDRGLQVFLNNLEKQNATMECINISDNPGRLHLGDFPITMSRFSQIRKLDLSRATSTSGDEPLIAAEVMLAWRLEELVLTGVPVNDKTLDAISAYLHSDMSKGLRLLQMDQCNLTGSHVAVLMRSMCHAPGEARDMQLHISANRLEKGNSDIAKAIKDCCTPSHLVMRMVEYETESRFRQLLEALRENTTIRSLDISKASLPYDAGEDTCTALQRLFAENTTLEELDISGEQAHLEVARFGIGLNHALTGLKKNKALRVLKLEYQNLGLEGANTLSSVIENNDTLTHIYCEHNSINLQGFTVLVNAVAKNFTILSLPLMEHDQEDSVKRMRSVIDETRNATKTGSGAKSAVRKTLTTFGVHVKEHPMPTPQDIDQAIQILNARWAKQKERLMELLQRNLNIAQGLETRSMYEGDNEMSKIMRPSTAGSDSFIVESVMRNTTPRVEGPNPVDLHMDGWSTKSSVDDNARADGSPRKLRRRDRSVSEVTATTARLELGAE